MANKNLILMSYTRIPGRRLYRGTVEVCVAVSSVLEEALKDPKNATATFDGVTLDKFLEAVHALLVESPDLDVVVQQGKSNPLLTLPASMRDSIRDDLRAACMQWAPTERIVYVRKDQPCLQHQEPNSHQ